MRVVDKFEYDNYNTDYYTDDNHADVIRPNFH